MDIRHRQGHFGEAYVALIAASAGLTVARTHPDVDGADLIVGYKGQMGNTRHPKIEVQVKTWSKPKFDEHQWRYRMSSPQFNELAGRDYSLPRVLALVIVPSDPADYILPGRSEIAVRNLAYWASLEHLERIDETVQATVPVDIPRCNVLTGDSLKLLVTRSASTKVER